MTEGWWQRDRSQPPVSASRAPPGVPGPQLSRVCSSPGSRACPRHADLVLLPTAPQVQAPPPPLLPLWGSAPLEHSPRGSEGTTQWPVQQVGAMASACSPYSQDTRWHWGPFQSPPGAECETKRVKSPGRVPAR